MRFVPVLILLVVAALVISASPFPQLTEGEIEYVQAANDGDTSISISGIPDIYKMFIIKTFLRVHNTANTPQNYTTLMRFNDDETKFYGQYYSDSNGDFVQIKPHINGVPSGNSAYQLDEEVTLPPRAKYDYNGMISIDDFTASADKNIWSQHGSIWAKAFRESVGNQAWHNGIDKINKIEIFSSNPNVVFDEGSFVWIIGKHEVFEVD